MKFLVFPILAALTACTAVSPPPPEASPPAAADPRSGRIREAIEADLRDQQNPAVLAEIARAPSAIVLRRSISLPRMIQQPDGSYRPEQPSIVAALRTIEGWIRITRGGERSAFDPVTGRELDRLLASAQLWSEAATTPITCTDAGGVAMIVRHRGRERVSSQPCAAEGLTGRLGEIVMAGRVGSWGGTPAEAQPSGIAIARLPDEVYRAYRFSSGIYDARNLVIRDERTWLGQWRRITSGAAASPPPVDFGGEMLLLAGMGTRPTGGYSVEVERVIDTGADLEAHVVHRSPGRRCGTTAAITRPIDIVRVPASPKAVRWVVRQAVTDCR